MELDWERKARELKEMSQELDLWSHKAKGREKLVLGRMSDELKRLSNQITYLLRDPDDAVPFYQREIPDWLADPVEFDLDHDEEADEGWYEDDEYYNEDYDESESDQPPEI